jgi:hypothetical protein
MIWLQNYTSNFADKPNLALRKVFSELHMSIRQGTCLNSSRNSWRPVCAKFQAGDRGKVLSVLAFEPKINWTGLDLGCYSVSENILKQSRQ